MYLDLFSISACEDKELELAHYSLLPVAEEYEARLKRASIEDNPIPHLNFFFAGDVSIFYVFFPLLQSVLFKGLISFYITIYGELTVNLAQ